MDNRYFRIRRRNFLKVLGGIGASCFLSPSLLRASDKALIRRGIPVSKEQIPVIGMGSWITFNVRDDRKARASRVEILRSFFEQGGALIDSSPMYGSSEEVIGYCLKQLQYPQPLFSATKVWTWGRDLGISQMESSQQLWGVKRFDLMQIHNLLDWETHLQTLRAWKTEGRIRYIGVTTSHGRRHHDLENLLRKESVDFVQFTYNIVDREVEQRLLPLAAERGVAVIINRPFQGGDLFDHVQGKSLPAWAADFDCQNWAQFFLKFIVSHPAVTCTIPATSQLAHMKENMGACYGALPDEATRKRMIRHIQAL